MFYQTFLPLQVKQCAIITYKDDIRAASQAAELVKI